MSYRQTFRVQDREIMYAQHARIKKRMGINQIAMVTDRPVSTIQLHVEHSERASGVIVDNRRNTPTSRKKGRWSFLDKRPLLSIGFRLFMQGFIEKVEDAFSPILIAMFGKVASENSSQEESEDPA